MPQQTTPKKQGDERSPWFRFAGLGVELAGAVFGFVLVGLWIDKSFGTHPWGLLICALCGLVGGLYNFIRSSLRALRTAGPNRSERRRPERPEHQDNER
jgi:F0F1-type ATP synthase assembly protein I